MRRYLYMVFVIAALLAGTAARGAQVAGISGMVSDPEAALDGSAETSATLSKPSGKDYFEFILHLDEESFLESIHLYMSQTPKDVILESSVDIVNWTPRSLALLASEELEMQYIEVDITDRAPAQYFRLKILGTDAEELHIYDLGVEFSQMEPNRVMDVKVEPVSDTSVAVVYSTELPAQTHVGYGPEGPVMTNVYIDRFKTENHRALLENLLPGTEYYYQVKLTDTEESSELRKFKTTGDPLPYIRRIEIPEAPGHDSAVLNLGANKPVSWEVIWGKYTEDMPQDKPESAQFSQLKKSEDNTAEYSVDFQELEPNTRYFFKVKIEDEKGEKSESELMGFDTSPLNLALGAAVTGTFTHELQDKYIKRTDEPMARVTDGDENYRTGFAKSNKPAYEDQWIEIDLGEDLRVEKIVIVWSDLSVPEYYTVSVRTESGEVADVLQVDNNEYPEDVAVNERRSLPGGDPLREVTAGAGSEFRYIRIVIPKGTAMVSRFGWKYALLAEVKAIAP